MWVTLVVACVITCLAICDSRSLYYKVSTGQVFGPFAEEQVISWYRDGYFQGDHVQVSEHPSEIFLPVEELVKSYSRPFLARPKSKSLIAKLGKKAGAVYKVQRTKLKGIANSITSVYPKPQRKENMDKHDGNSFESLSGFKSADSSSTQPQEQPNVVSLQNEPPLKPSDGLELIDSIDSSSFLDSSGYSDHEQDMLAQLKRDDTPTKHPESAATPSENPPTDYHMDRRKGDRETLKYSVKSLPKGDYALWDAEDVKSKSSAMDKLLKDFESPQPVSTENSNQVSRFAAKGSKTKQLMNQVRAVMLEMLRFAAGLLMRLLPGPMQQSAALVGLLLATSENQAVLVSLLILGVLSLLQGVMYTMLLPSFCALLWTVAPAMQTGLKAATIDAATFSSAKAGEIVTTVFQNIAADAPSVHAVHASVIDISPASVSTYFHDLMMTLRKLKQDDLRSAVSASFEKLNSAKTLRYEDVVNVLVRAQIGLRSRLHQLASIEKEAVVVMLIVSALAVLHTVLLPLVEAKLAYSEVSLLIESEETFTENEDFEDELLPTSSRGSTVSGEKENQVLCASGDVTPPLRRVSAVALTNHVRSVSATVFRLIVCGLFLSLLHSAVLPSLPEHSKMRLVAPLAVSLLSSVLSLYFQPRGLLPSARGSVETLSIIENVENLEDTASRLNYLSNLVDNEHQWAECKRWGMDAYILSLLEHESNLISAEKTKTDEHLIQRAAPRNLREHPQLFTLFSAITVLLLSVFSWMQLRTGHIWSELPLHSMNIAQAAEDVLRASRSEKVDLYYGVKVADALFLRPLEWLQSVASVLLAWGRTVGGAGHTTDPSTLFTLNTGSAHRVIITNVFNTALIITVVLILPSLLQILQAVKLSAVRTQYEVLSRDLEPTSAADRANHAQRAHITKSLRRSKQVLSSAQKDQQKKPQEVATGRSTQGPNVSTGMELQNVTAMRNGRIVLKDVSLRLPAGSITVIVSPTNSADDSDAASTLLSLLWAQSASLSGAKNREGSVQQLDGTIFVQGRELNDWHKDALSEQCTYLSAEEEPLRIHAGALAGCLPGTAGEPLRHALRAQAASGAYKIITSLPAGPATVVGAQNTGSMSGGRAARSNILAGEVELAPDHMAALHLSRALCHINKPFVLLTGPTDNMSEDQERLFFDYLRSQVRPDQVIVLTSARQRTAELFGDHVIVLEEGGGCAVVTTLKADDTPSTAI